MHNHTPHLELCFKLRNHLQIVGIVTGHFLYDLLWETGYIVVQKYPLFIRAEVHRLSEFKGIVTNDYHQRI